MNFFRNFEAITSSFLLFAMTVVIIIQVIFRYFISYSLAWPEELGRFLFIATVYIGASYAEQQEKHLAITVLRTNAGAFCAKYVPIFAQAVTVAFSAVVTLWGIEMVKFMYASNQLAPAIEIPMFYVFTVLPIGMGLMTIRATINFVTYVKRAFS